MSKDTILTAVGLIVVALLIAGDVGLDLGSGGSLAHILIEGAIFLMAIGGLGVMVRRYFAMRKEREKLLFTLAKSREDAISWRREAEKYLDGLGVAIDSQMSKWNFTLAEKEIGLLILKGFSFKEIAALRNTSERTTRQQSLEIYRKSGLSGRAEFSAFFLEDLLLPTKRNEEL